MDWQSIQPIFHWLSDHPFWSGLFVFLIALTESLVIVGLVVPGTVLMFGVGTLVGAGVLDVKLVLFLAFIGAVLGDGISFWVGAHYRERIAEFWPFKKKPELLEKGKSFFLKHGGKSIFFGRFVGPVRPVIPAVAGMMHMSPRRFFAINVLSAAGWAPFYLIPGILFGTSIGLASAIGSRLVIVLLTLFVSIVVLIVITKKTMKYVVPKIEDWFSLLISWSGRHRILGPAIVALLDSEKDVKRALPQAILVCSFSLLFLSVFILSLWSGRIRDIDSAMQNIMSVLSSSLVDELMWVLQSTGHWLVVLAFYINVCIGFYHRNLIKALRYFLFCNVVVLVFVSLFFVAGQNFSGAQFETSGLLSTALFFSGVLFYLVIASESMRENYRWVMYSAGLLLVFFYFLSQLYFSNITLSQSVLIVSLVLVIVILSSLAYRRHLHNVVPIGSLTMSSLAILFLLVTLTVTNNINRSKLLAVDDEVLQLSKPEWLADDWQALPNHRSDVLGHSKQALNVQWLANKDEIHTSLLAADWQKSSAVNFRSLLYWLAPEPDVQQISRLPQTHLGQTEDLLYVKNAPGQNRQYVLQLWQSRSKNEDDPFWVGSLTEQRLISGDRWLAYFKIENSNIDELSRLLKLDNHWLHQFKGRLSSTSAEQENLILLYK